MSSALSCVAVNAPAHESHMLATRLKLAYWHAQLPTCVGRSSLSCSSLKPLLGRTATPTGMLHKLHWCHNTSSGSCTRCCCSSSRGGNRPTRAPLLLLLLEPPATWYRLTAPGWAPAAAAATASVPRTCAAGLVTTRDNPSCVNATCGAAAPGAMRLLVL